MDLIAIQNFHSVERFLSSSGILAAADIHTLGPTETRTLLRHFVGEQNRFYFEQWEWMQLGVGLSFVLLLVFGTRPPKVAILLSLAMLGIVLAQRIGLTPQISKIGRSLDFVAPNAQGTATKIFWTLHSVYSGLELLKIGLGLVIAGLLTIRRKPDRQMFARESELDELPVVGRARS